MAPSSGEALLTGSAEKALFTGSVGRGIVDWLFRGGIAGLLSTGGVAKSRIGGYGCGTIYGTYEHVEPRPTWMHIVYTWSLKGHLFRNPLRARPDPSASDICGNYPEASPEENKGANARNREKLV